MISLSEFWKSREGRAGLTLLSLAAVIMAMLFLHASYERTVEMRQSERVPQTMVSAVVSGEVKLQGRIEEADLLLIAPGSQVPSVFYRLRSSKTDVKNYDYMREGKIEPKSVQRPNAQNQVDFFLNDGSGRILVSPSWATNYRVDAGWSEHHGSILQTEMRLEPGTQVSIFGYALRGEDGYRVVFDHPGVYQPTISSNDDHGRRSDTAFLNTLGLLAALALLSMVLITLFGLFRIHHSAVYLIGVSLLLAAVLLIFGLFVLRADYEHSAERSRRAVVESHAVITEILGRHGIDWDGQWSSLGSFSSPRYTALNDVESRRARDVRAFAARSASRLHVGLSSFPVNYLAGMWDLDAPPMIFLEPADQAYADALELEFKPVSFGLFKGLLALVIGLLTTFYASRRGIRQLATKRVVEDLPTSEIGGAAYGMIELIGIAAIDETREALKSFPGAYTCVYFHEVAMSRSGEGWMLDSDRQGSRRFYCRDETGRILVDPKGATFLVDWSVDTDRQRLQIIRPGEQVYVLGKAEIDPKTHDRLIVTAGEDDVPFIISSLPEQEILYRLARSSLLWLNLGLLAAITTALAAYASLVSFGLNLYVAAAASAVGYLLLILCILYYNGMVFLRGRVERNWANIDVALKKRFDLLIRLKEVAAAYLVHEEEVHTLIAAARACQDSAAILDPVLSKEFLHLENRLLRSIEVTLESYPDLKGHELVCELMDQLKGIENEVALMTTGYNASVERYNTRIRSIPEIFIALPLRFRKAAYFESFEAEAVT